MKYYNINQLAIYFYKYAQEHIEMFSNENLKEAINSILNAIDSESYYYFTVELMNYNQLMASVDSDCNKNDIEWANNITNKSLAVKLLKGLAEIISDIKISLKILKIIPNTMYESNSALLKHENVYIKYFDNYEQIFNHASNINLKIIVCMTKLKQIESNLKELYEESDNFINILFELKNNYTESLEILSDCLTDLGIDSNKSYNLPILIGQLETSIDNEISYYQKFDEQEYDGEEE